MKILFFDGVCNFCNSFVWFLLPKLKVKDLHFASLQGETALKHLSDTKYGKELQNPTTVIFYNDGEIFDKSDAALAVINLLRFPWSFPVALKIIPKSIRNFFYMIISRNRYSWFGKRDACRIPSEQERSFFLP